MLSMNRKLTGASAVIAMAVGFSGFSSAASVVVNATDVIYAAGTQNGEAATAGGTVPAAIIPINGGSTIVFTSVQGSITTGCASMEGCITVDSTTTPVNYNNPDGVGGLPASSSSTGFGSISGITGPGAGYLVGVFLTTGGPTGSAPPALNFVSGTPGNITFSTLAPALDQVFFVGDGLSGATFIAPPGASSLVLGISDSCTGPGYSGQYSGPPGCYGDNLGTFTVNYTITLPSIPVPPSILLTLVGLACGAMFLGYRGLSVRGNA